MSPVMPNEPVVVDASVAAKWVLVGEAQAEEAARLGVDIRQKRLLPVVPAFWDYEVASVLSKAVANRRLSEVDARAALAELLLMDRISVEFPSPAEAFDTARRLGRGVIDCFYVVIAEARGCDFWTDDQKLVRSLSDRYPFVRWIGDYPVPPPSPVP
jgi:predicted nucleic acid-binding protein